MRCHKLGSNLSLYLENNTSKEEHSSAYHTRVHYARAALVEQATVDQFTEVSSIKGSKYLLQIVPQCTVDSNLKGPKQVSQIYTQGP